MLAHCVLVHHVRVWCVEELKWEHIARWVSHWAIHVTRNLQISVMGKRWPRGAPSLHICTSMLWHIQATHPESLDGPMYTNWRQVSTRLRLIGTLWSCRVRAAGCYVFCRLACLGPICVIRPSPPAAAKHRAAKIWGKSAKNLGNFVKCGGWGIWVALGWTCQWSRLNFLNCNWPAWGIRSTSTRNTILWNT